MVKDAHLMQDYIEIQTQHFFERLATSIVFVKLKLVQLLKKHLETLPFGRKSERKSTT